MDKILTRLEYLVAAVQDIAQDMVSKLDAMECATPKSPSTTSTQPLRQAPALSMQQQQQRLHNETREPQEGNILRQDNFPNEGNDGHTLQEDPNIEAAKTKAEVSIIAKCEDSVLGDEKQFRGAFATAASGVDEDKTNDPVCGNLGDTCCEQSLQALHDEVSTIGIPVDFVSYSNGDYEDGTRFGSEKQLDKLLPEERPSAACIALDRYKVWRRKRGRYHVMS